MHRCIAGEVEEWKFEEEGAGPSEIQERRGEMGQSAGENSLPNLQIKDIMTHTFIAKSTKGEILLCFLLGLTFIFILMPWFAPSQQFLNSKTQTDTKAKKCELIFFPESVHFCNELLKYRFTTERWQLEICIFMLN